jgi:glycosyltransferase involved in cell wall biosynthesis
VSVVIPAYNEAATLEQVIRRVAEQPLRIEAIVVDDGSSDSTQAVLQRLQREGVGELRVLRHASNSGKSAAVRTGINDSRGDIVLIQDADLEYDPQDLPRLVAPIVEGHADVVYGSRLRGGQPQRAHLFWHYLGNRFLSLLTNVLYNTTKAFRGDLIRSVQLVSEGFGFEPEITAKLLRRGDIRLYEIPVSYYGRTYAEGKKITWRDGVTAVRLLLRFRFARSEP